MKLPQGPIQYCTVLGKTFPFCQHTMISIGSISQLPAHFHKTDMVFECWSLSIWQKYSTINKKKVAGIVWSNSWPWIYKKIGPRAYILPHKVLLTFLSCLCKKQHVNLYTRNTCNICDYLNIIKLMLANRNIRTIAIVKMPLVWPTWNFMTENNIEGGEQQSQNN